MALTNFAGEEKIPARRGRVQVRKGCVAVSRLAVDPVRLLESLGVNEFSIDWEARKVRLPRRYFIRAYGYMIGGKPLQEVIVLGDTSPLYAECIAFEVCGWRWEVEKPENNTEIT